jgi:hypothetical protein
MSVNFAVPRPEHTSFEPEAKQDVVTVPALGLSLENAREASAADNNIRPGSFDMDQRRDLAAR